MQSNTDSTDRSAADMALFSIAFIGFMLAVSGIVIAFPPVAIFGVLVLLFSVFALGCR